MNVSFNKLNNYIGWLVFIISALTYLITIEPNISFWDCGEYISSAAKLEVTHSPGAAFFQLLGAVFAGFAFGDGSKYAMIINSMNAILSAFAILFMFWSITHLVRKAIGWNNNFEEFTSTQKIVILTAGLIGSLTFAFTDTFWYSAVEGEVYAISSMFTALLVWLICKWENDDSERANRWLVLIAFIIGISVGVHMMVLLAVPTVCYIYYTKKHEITLKSFVIANVITVIVLAFVFKLFFPFVMTVFGNSEIYLVNELGLPFNSGLVFALAVFVAFFYFSLTYFKKKNWNILYTVVISIAFMLVGFSCWLMIPIRANANPPMNLNNPDNALGMKDYYNREQYGEWPVLYGANYTAYIDNKGIEKTIDTDPIYEKNEKTGVYDKVGSRFDYVFDSKHEGFLPRMYYGDNSTGVQDNYGRFEGYPEFKINPEYAGTPEVEELVSKLEEKKKSGDISIKDYEQFKEYISLEKPTFVQNMDFMMSFQFGQMFLRYFLWNFAGKQNDLEWQYDDFRGNWEDGIVRNSSELPAIFKNKGTNHYFFLPLILGLIGFFFQLNKDVGRMYALLALFLLTGIGIILYTSVKPFEPRERDYALVGSFYVFGIWTGIGAGALLYFLQMKVKQNAALLGAIVLLLGIPFLLAFQNWDDHDRSRRTTAYDQAYSYLKPLEKEAILFTYGDNDTYPLWGAQETSGIRKDVKVVNFTLLGTSWYIDQVRRKTYEADAIPGSLKHEEYRENSNDAVYILSKNDIEPLFSDSVRVQLQENGQSIAHLSEFQQYITKDSMTIKEALAFIKNNSKGKQAIKQIFFNSTSADLNVLPVTKIIIPVNKVNALKYGIINKEDAALMLDHITINMRGSVLRKAELAMLDMFANYNWDRPIYFGAGAIGDPSNTFYLNEYLEYQGFSYKLVPIKTKRNQDGEYGRVNAMNLYSIIKQFKWGNFKDPKMHTDETGLRNIASYRQSIGRAVPALVKIGRKDLAKELLELCMHEIPIKLHSKGLSLNELVHGYILIGDEKKALEIAENYKKSLFDELGFYMKLSKEDQYFVSNDMDRAAVYYAYLTESVVKGYREIGQEDKAYSYAENSFKPIDQRLNAIFTKIKENANPKNQSEQQYNLDALYQSYMQLSEIVKPMDSIYFYEKMENLERRMKEANVK